MKTDLIEIEVTNLKDCVGVTNHELPNTLYLKRFFEALIEWVLQF